MELELTATVRYRTGNSDKETQAAYLTTDPEECAGVDRANVKMLGLYDFLSFIVDDPTTVITWEIKPVTE